MGSSMQGKVVLITGANAGIGKATAMELARKGATVVVGARSREKAEHAQAEIKKKTGNENIDVLLGDLASFSSVRDMANDFLGRYDRLDVLINNAGLILTERKETEDKNEVTIQVNHLSHFLLTHLLLDLLKATAPSRVINVSSDAYKAIPQGMPMTIEGLNCMDSFSAIKAYGQSKLANILFSRALATRLASTGVDVNALHPGAVRTRFGMDGDIHGFFRWILAAVRPFMKSPKSGAKTPVFLASAPELEGVSGKYFASKSESLLEPFAEDDEAAQKLWEMSAALTGVGRE